MRYSIPRKSRRVPLVTDVHLKLEELPDPVTAVTTNVSLGGMSVAIQRPAEIGSLAAFELEVGGALVEGTGEVAWIRGGGDGPDQTSGMGIRFRYLSPGSRERIFRLVQWYASQGAGASGEAVVAATPSLAPPPSGLRAAPPRGEAGPEPAAEETIAPGSRPVASPRPLPSGRLVPSEPEPLVPEDLLSGFSLDPPPPPPQPESRYSEPRSPEPETTELSEPPPPASASDLEWVSAAEIRATEPVRDLVLPLPPEEERVSPAEVAKAVPSFSRPAQSFRGAGYARPRRFSPWGILAGLLLLGLAALAAWSWWPNLPLLLGQAHPADPSSTSTPAVEVNVPTREDAVRTDPSPAAVPPATPEPSPPATESSVPAAAAPTETTPAQPVVPAPTSPAPTAALATTPARSVNRISWETGDGATTLVLEGDGAFKSSQVTASLLSGDNPRVLVKIKGIERKVAPDRIRVDSAEVATIRVGLHDLPAGSELWVVLDLRARDLELAGTRVSGNEVRLTVRQSR